jgi:hypothetical protein
MRIISGNNSSDAQIEENNSFVIHTEFLKIVRELIIQLVPELNYNSCVIPMERPIIPMQFFLPFRRSYKVGIIIPMMNNSRILVIRTTWELLWELFDVRIILLTA